MEAVLPMLFLRHLSLSLPWFPFPVHLRRGEREVLVSTWYPARVTQHNTAFRMSHPGCLLNFCSTSWCWLSTVKTSSQILPPEQGGLVRSWPWPHFSLDPAKHRSRKTIWSACETVSKFKDSRAAGNYSNVRFLWGINLLCVFSYSSLPLYLAFAILSLKLVTWCFLSLLDKSAWKLRICKCGVSCYYHL